MNDNLNDAIEAFLVEGPELKASEVKDYVLKKRGTLEGYTSEKTFRDTIQDVINKHCPTAKTYNQRQPVFEKLEHARYRLVDWNYWAKELGFNLEQSEVSEVEYTERKLKQLNIIDRNRQHVLFLKQLYENQCQICQIKLKISDKQFYSEVHHIQALGEPDNGPDIQKNMIVVCPNCHVLLDFKSIPISQQDIKWKSPHKIDPKYIEYHNSVCKQKER